MIIMINNGINTLNLVSNESNDKGNQRTYYLHLIMIWSVLIGLLGNTLIVIAIRVHGLLNDIPLSV